MNIERYIFVFKKEEGDIVKEINVTFLNISIFENNFTAKSNDPNFYAPYKIEGEQYFELIKFIPELEFYPNSQFEYYIEAISV